MALAGILAKSARIGVKAPRGSDFALRMAFLTVFLASLCLRSSFGQTSTNASSQPGNRYLFVVETSHAMQGRAQGVFDTLKQALDSGLNGQIRQGDIVGIWTFNENVYQGLFPSQKWSQATQLAFAVRLPALQEPETYLKRARLEKLLPEVLQAISGSEAITVVLISSGEGTMKGTPFDEQINAAWKEWHDEQEGVHMPIVTVLRARLDEITDWSLTPAPRPIEVPTVVSDAKKNERNTSTPPQAQKPREPAKWGPEQQVAFSVWALGQTGAVARALAPTNPSPAALDQEVAQGKNAKEAAIPPASNPSAAPARVETVENQPATNLTVTFIPPQEAQAAPVVKAAEPSEHKDSKELQDAGQSQAQPVQSRATDPAPSTAAQPLPIPDASLGAPMVAHARSADSGEETRIAPGAALAAPPRSFMRENINPLVLLIVAAFGAGYCFRNWFLTESRTRGTTTSLTRVKRED
jgi:hypothetical protein